jgi:hypothetical protein
VHAKQKKSKTGRKAPDVDFSVQSISSPGQRILPELCGARRWGSIANLFAGKYLRHSNLDFSGINKCLAASLFG